MKSLCGQALVELAICMPVVLLLGLGTAEVVQVADATAGLQAATEAAVTAASRAPDPLEAATAAEARFRAVIAAYPIESADLVLADGGLIRGSVVTASSTGVVDLSWQSLPILPARMRITARASMRAEPWRTHR